MKHYTNCKSFSFKTPHRMFILKKILNILYRSNVNYKRILFIGIDKKYYGVLSYIKLKTNHCFVKNHFWLNGLLSNKTVVNYLHLLSSSVCFKNLSFKSSFSLFIVLNKLITKTEVIKSSLVTVISDGHLVSKYFSYNINGKIDNHLLVLLIYLTIQII